MRTPTVLFTRALAVMLAVVAFVGCDLRGVSYASDDYPAIITQEFGDVGPSAVRVADCESTLHPDAYNAGNYGLFQINRVHADDFEAVTGQPFHDAVLDGYWNTVYAKHLYDEQGWGPWSCRWAA